MSSRRYKKYHPRRQRKPTRARKKVRKIRRKAVAKTKRPSIPEVKFDWERAASEVAERGKNRGFVTEAEILHAMPYIEENLEALEQLLAALEAKGIEVVDQEVASVWEQAKSLIS